jgi:hypothetical protein
MKLFANTKKPKILVAVLTGAERQNWINPDLTRNLMRMARDTRFDVDYFPVHDCRPWEVARNLTISTARQLKADWVISFDNDNFLPGDVNPLDIIATAGEDQHVIGLTYGMRSADESHVCCVFPGSRGKSDGAFHEVQGLGGGVLMVRNTVWQKIPKGPWFRWVHQENEIQEGEYGEDMYFCQLAQQNGFKLWTCDQMAGHYRTMDITKLFVQTAQIGKARGK